MRPGAHCKGMEMTLSRAARRMAGLTIVLVPTIEYGGVFLLSLLRSGDPLYTDGVVGRAFLRAGHAHAGVLVILGLVCQMLLDDARLPHRWAWAARIGFFVAPLLVSGGFFAGAPQGDGAPGAGVNLVYVGAAVLAASLLTLGVGLLRPRAPVAPVHDAPVEA